MASWRELPGPARAIGTAITRAVDAAAARDREAYRRAAADLLAVPPEPAGYLLGALVRALLEEQHPDGLDSDDIQAVLRRGHRWATGWLPADRVDPHTLLAALASALGVHEPGVTYQEVGAGAGERGGDDWTSTPIGGYTAGTAPVPVPTAAGYAWHAPLLIADLLATGRRPLGRYLDAAFAEIARAETMDVP